MRVLEDRYSRDRARFDLALRFIGLEARTHTIREWTGLTEDRVRKLYRTYLSENPGQHVVRRRGKSPRRCGWFLRTPRIQQEAAVLAGLYCVLGLLSRRHPGTGTPAPSRISQGELLCLAYETYCALLPSPRISFEHAVFLAMAIARGDEIDLRHCEHCHALTLGEGLRLRATLCPSCEHSGIALPRGGHRLVAGAAPASARGTPAPARLGQAQPPRQGP